MSRPSRNAPCPCGGDKCFKERHGALHSPRPNTGAPVDHMAKAQSALADALSWLQRALAEDPGNAELRREVARTSWHFRAGVDAKVAARRQAGEGRHAPVRRRTQTSGSGSGYQVSRWSNS